jgi:putative nucleotidyltransferase with HDIG domain
VAISPHTSAIIRGRPRAGPIAGLIMSVVFGALMTLVATADSWVVDRDAFVVGRPAPITVRVPLFQGFRADGGGLSAGGGAILIDRGDVVDARTADLIAAIRGDDESSAPAYAGAFFLLALLYTTYLRRSHRGKLLRTQAVSMALMIAVAIGVKVTMLTTPMSILVVPVAGAAIVATLAVDLYAGLATAFMAAFVIGLLTPFDAGVLAVLAIQAVATVLALGDGRRRSRTLAGAAGGLAAALAYTVFYYLAWRQAPLLELETPFRSALVAALAGGVLSGAVSLIAYPVYQWLLGEITAARLVELADLSNPMLRRIAENAPGTWQHSLAMANMAEIAANAVGANARLVRVGALYHDLGKSLQPKYYIENLTPGEGSPHEGLEPAISCDAIFSHVTEGVRLARKERLPERIIDFMHMHHGDGLLEYFWAKCKEQGNPENLTVENFRYPGIRPQNRETAIIAICDAVEAASRTLKQPDARAIENLVQRIVYGKLHLGQLDESGLAMADLRKLSNSLMDTIKHAHHVRVEYPWQREEREAAARAQPEAERTTAPEARRGLDAEEPPPRPGDRVSTQRVYREPPLDSLDVPRAYWREPARDPATAPTELIERPAASAGGDGDRPRRDSGNGSADGATEGATDHERELAATGTSPGVPRRAEVAAPGAVAPPEGATVALRRPGAAGPAAPPAPEPVGAESGDPDGAPGPAGPPPARPEPEPRPPRDPDGLEPGVMVLGPPPATHRRAATKSDTHSSTKKSGDG